MLLFITILLITTMTERAGGRGGVGRRQRAGEREGLAGASRVPGPSACTHAGAGPWHVKHWRVERRFHVHPPHAQDQ